MLSADMIDEFRNWFKANRKKLEAEPIFAKIRRAEIEDQISMPPLLKASLDLKTNEYLANFTVWGSGELQIIIMSDKTGEELVVDERRFENPADIGPLLDSYCAQISRKGPFAPP